MCVCCLLTAPCSGARPRTPIPERTRIRTVMRVCARAEAERGLLWKLGQRYASVRGGARGAVITMRALDVPLEEEEEEEEEEVLCLMPSGRGAGW